MEKTKSRFSYAFLGLSMAILLTFGGLFLTACETGVERWEIEVTDAYYLDQLSEGNVTLTISLTNWGEKQKTFKQSDWNLIVGQKSYEVEEMYYCVEKNNETLVTLVKLNVDQTAQLKFVFKTGKYDQNKEYDLKLNNSKVYSGTFEFRNKLVIQ